MKNNLKKWISFAVVLAILIGVSFASVNLISAEQVLVEEVKDPSLQFVTIHGKKGWTPKGSYNENGNKYTMTSNAWAQWEDEDSIHFAYKEIRFNYGKKAELTAETRLDYWDATESVEAGAGILLRNSLDPSSATVMIHCRPSRIMVTYRSTDGFRSLKGKIVNYSISSGPVGLKLVYSGSKVKVYYETGNGIFAELATVPFVQTGNNVFIGLSAYSQSETDHATAKFTGFCAKTTVPEGTKIPEEGQPPVEEEPEEEIVLEDTDLDIKTMLLVKEDFEDKSLNGDGSANNPKWTYNNRSYSFTKKDGNTSLSTAMSSSSDYFYVGEQNWNDYVFTADITFDENVDTEFDNNIYFYIRHKDTNLTNNYDLCVQLMNGKTIEVSRRENMNSPTLGGHTIDNEKILLEYLKDAGKTHQIKVLAIDNRFRVYWDDKLMIDKTVDGFETGSIGFSARNAAFSIDNISVYKVTEVSDVLLRETFSDNSLTEGDASAQNPIWQIYNKPEIILSEDKNNRYLYDWNIENAYYYAGDQHWTDYSVSMDLTFTQEFSDEEKNGFFVYIRHTDIAQYGYHDYVVSFEMDNIEKQYLKIGTRTGESRPDAAPTNVAKVEYKYLDNPNVLKKLYIEAFDNRITVYIDGVKLLEYVDETIEVKSKGNIGIMSNMAAVKVDNIVVRKLTDLIGGDYDNTIMGAWDEPVSDVVKWFEENGYDY